jgi:hypothetical protein
MRESYEHKVYLKRSNEEKIIPSRPHFKKESLRIKEEADRFIKCLIASDAMI